MACRIPRGRGRGLQQASDLYSPSPVVQVRLSLPKVHSLVSRTNPATTLGSGPGLSIWVILDLSFLICRVG